VPAGRLHRRLVAGDTDFSLTTEFDRWDADGVRFVFGYDARANLVARAADAPDELYHDLVARAERQIATSPRTRPRNHKDDVVRQRGYKVLRQKNEEVVEFSYRPGKCHKDYRVVALPKNISVERGDNVLFCAYRYFFYITNDRASPRTRSSPRPDSAATRRTSSASSKEGYGPCTPGSTPSTPTGPT
jgi:hypothetical protein